MSTQFSPRAYLEQCEVDLEVARIIGLSAISYDEHQLEYVNGVWENDPEEEVEEIDELEVGI